MTCDIPNCILHKPERAERERDVQDVNHFLFTHEHSQFWRSIEGVTICGVCHPPAGEELIEELSHGKDPKN